jgi:hypothetical protein
MRDGQLLTLAQDCHPLSPRQMRWGNALVKETSAKVLVAT